MDQSAANEPFGNLANRRHGKTHLVARPAKHAERVFSAANAGLGENGRVQRRQTVLDAQGMAVIALEHRLHQFGAKRGATLATTEMHPCAPAAMHERAVMSSP